MLGAVGLLLAVISGSVLILSIFSNGQDLPLLLALTSIGLLLWGLVIASQAHLRLWTVVTWFPVVLLLGGTVVLAMALEKVGLKSRPSDAPILSFWPRGAIAAHALWRVGVGKASSEDSVLLARGPSAALGRDRDPGREG